MKLSVIIPAYNEENYIGDCLQSLHNQIDPPDEIIVIDNNSTDKTVTIAKQYNATIIKEPKQGIIHARNKGYNHTKHTLIARIDADVIVPANWIQTIKHSFKENNIDALTGPLIYYDLPFKSAIYARTFFTGMKLLLNGNETLIGPNMVITKHIWKKIGKNLCKDGGKVHEDTDLGLHIIEAGGTIRRDNDLIVQSSARRIRENPSSFFIEYPYRLYKTLKSHKKSIINKGKDG